MKIRIHMEHKKTSKNPEIFIESYALTPVLTGVNTCDSITFSGGFDGFFMFHMDTDFQRKYSFCVDRAKRQSKIPKI